MVYEFGAFVNPRERSSRSHNKNSPRVWEKGKDKNVLRELEREREREKKRELERDVCCVQDRLLCNNHYHHYFHDQKNVHFTALSASQRLS